MPVLDQDVVSSRQRKNKAMESLKASSRFKVATTTLLTAMAAAAVVATITLAPHPAAAKPEFAAQTGKPCGQCHVSPGGGGALKPFGQKFKANGFKIK
jgi:hypothetical protein